jgi:osmotically-inducible protein OsmY
MADRNRNRSSYASDENWDQNQNRYGRESDYNQGNYGNVNYDRENEWNRTSGYGSNYGSSYGGYGNVGYGQSSEDDYRQRMGRQDYGGYGGSTYGGSYGGSYGTNYGSGGSGRRESDWGSRSRNVTGNLGNQYNRGDENYEGYGNRYNTSGGYSSDYGREDMGDYGNVSGRGYGSREQFGRQRMSGQRGDMYGREMGSMYGGDTSNYGNANQGAYDRGWWDRTRDEVSSWFGDDDAERRRRMDKLNVGAHRGKGPKGYHRSDERIKEDVCDRLSDNPMIDASDIEIKVNNSEVVLSGRVDNRDDKRRAEDIAESVSGVSNVQNQLRVGREDTSSMGRTGSTSTTTGERRSSRNE